MTSSEKHRQLVSLQIQIDDLNQQLEQLKNTPINTCCIECIYSDKANFFCSQWGEIVPDGHREQANCPYFDDDIPF